MKVYVVTAAYGDYGDYHVEAVYMNAEVAESLKSNGARVQVCDLDFWVECPRCSAQVGIRDIT